MLLSLRCRSAFSGCETDFVPTLSEIDAVRVSGSGKLRGVAGTAAATEGENERNIAFLEDTESGAMVKGLTVASATAGENEGTNALLEFSESAIAKVKGSAVASATSGATVGESERIIGSRESQIPSLSSSGCLSVHACASLSSAPASAASSRVCPRYPHLLLCLLLLYMRAPHPYTIRVQTRYRIRCWLSGAEKCV